MKCKELIQQFIGISIGNAAQTSFWYDAWYPSGPFYKVFPMSLLKDLGLYTGSLVVDFIHNDCWKWPQGRRLNSRVQEFKDATPLSLLHNLHREDHVKWLSSSTGLLSVKSVMRKLFSPGNNVSWYKIVWGNGHIPKFALAFWLAM